LACRFFAVSAWIMSVSSAETCSCHAASLSLAMFLKANST